MEGLNKTIKYSITLISLISLIGGIIYRLYALNWIGILMSIVLTIISTSIIIFFDQKYKTESQTEMSFYLKTTDPKSLIILIPYLVSAIACFFLLFQNQTANSIISPWEVVPQKFFIIYIIATILLILNILQKKKYTLPLITFHYCLSFLVCVIIYKIGFGFDPFIHEATINLIEKTGSVDPKPFYYLGQYSLVLILHKILFIPIGILNKTILPILAGIYLPIFLSHLAKSILPSQTKINLVIISLLSLPFSFFIITTPQGLSYFFLILTITIAGTCKNIRDLIIAYLLSATTFIIHPISGIPAIIFVLMITISNLDNKKIKKILIPISSILMAILLPVAFIITNIQQGEFKIGTENLRNLTLPQISIPNQENFALNFIELYHKNIGLVIFIILIFGFILSIKHKKECKKFLINFDAALALLIAFFLVNLFSFEFLISYERANYSNRILTIALLFLLPFFLISLYGVFEKLSQKNIFIKISLTSFLVLLITASIYNSYPRLDNYLNSKGYSTGKNEIEAVNWIEKDAEQNYIVLANQQVSAAALHEFGFSTYYKDDIFYYPIPTGGPLYKYYLKMVYESPNKTTMLDAMNLADVNQAYFVLNKYWWAFPKILEEAKLQADSWYKINEGEIFIFKYTK